MDESYIKSEKKANKLGEGILFINFLVIFVWLLYELFESFNSSPTWKWYISFNFIGLGTGLIFVSIFLFLIIKNMIRKLI